MDNEFEERQDVASDLIHMALQRHSDSSQFAPLFHAERRIDVVSAEHSSIRHRKVHILSRTYCCN